MRRAEPTVGEETREWMALAGVGQRHARARRVAALATAIALLAAGVTWLWMQGEAPWAPTPTATSTPNAGPNATPMSTPTSTGTSTSSAPPTSTPTEAPPPAPAPLSGEQVRRVVVKARKAWSSCIAKTAAVPLSRRKVKLTLTVEPAGRVTSPALDSRPVDHSALGACLKRVSRRMVFPPFDGQPLTVVVPLSLSASD
jgi:type IV secretory pathway VirB10-like protein